MADVCLIYAHPSKAVARRLFNVLSQRHDVWWDEQIHSGDYRTEIERQLSIAKCVIPIWCRISRADGDVIDEATFVRKRGIPLLPVRIEDVDAPLGFGSFHTIDLLGWSGDAEHPGIAELLRNIEKVLGSQPRLLFPRPDSLAVGNRSIPLPIFFPSVSSHETPLRPEGAVRALTLFGTPALLVSAYDMLHEQKQDVDRIAIDLETCRSAGAVVLLDSGNYEAYRKGDAAWSPDNLQQAITHTPHDLAFCFDNVEPPSDVYSVVRGVVAAVERDSKHTAKPVLPIVHVPRDSNGFAQADLAPEVVRLVTRELRPPLVAIPERELGDGLLSRARTVYSIRRSLDELGFYQPLHLLGTGNPISIAVLSAVGADSFDGLEWCRTVADHQTGCLYHFQQYEFFSWQSKLAMSPIVREAVASNKVDFSGKVVFHNLEFFSSWMNELRTHLLNGKIERFLSVHLPGTTTGIEMLESAVPEVFG